MDDESHAKWANNKNCDVFFLIQVIFKMDVFNYTWMHCYGKQTHPVCKYKNIQMRWDYNENNLSI